MGNCISNLVRTFDVYRLYKVILSFLLHLTHILVFNLILSPPAHVVQPLNRTLLLMMT